MKVYRDFAYLYSKGPYIFSERMAKHLPRALKKYKLSPKKVLDLGCGDGRFAVILARKGMEVTGVDASVEMLKYAREKARKAKVRINLIHQKMQNLSMKGRFDLVTCWFESLNYLLSKKELLKTFANVSRLLDEKGLFIFDILTIYGFSHYWTKHPAGVVQNKKDMFEVHYQPQFNKRTNTVSIEIAGFAKRQNRWYRIDETHKLKGYTLSEIRDCLRKAKLKELACSSSIQKMMSPKRTSIRVWFIVQRC